MTPEYLDHVLQLAHLEITDDEKKAFIQQLESILAHTKTLGRFQFNNIEPTLTLCEGPTPLREDVVVNHEPIDLELNAPQWEDGCYKVPKIK